VVAVNDVIEVSYTGDLLAHRRCPRAWAYENHVGFVPYEQVQAMEGRLLHHAMEWLARRYADDGVLARRAELEKQLDHYYRVLRSRGIVTAFATRQDVLDRILRNLYKTRRDNSKLQWTVETVIRGAEHTEYQLRSVRKVIPKDFAGKKKILLTGIIDLVLQQPDSLTYHRSWKWDDRDELLGHVEHEEVKAKPGDQEIWDFKATRAASEFQIDYVRQVATYAALYRERTGELPERCVLFFVNEREEENRLLAIPIDDEIVEKALEWTVGQVERLRATTIEFSKSPMAVAGGSLLEMGKPVGERITGELKKQCTACAQRFDCDEYKAHLKKESPGRLDRETNALRIDRT
jgi:DNA helicase-2/ATP-dependent DNA helicase PcrA